jgi:hypothetical protein
MNAAFRQNLSVVFTFDGNNSGIARDTRGSLGDVPDRARFCRTTATPHVGRERPPRIEARDRVRGVAEGVAHALDAYFAATDSRAHSDAGGTERRPVQHSEVAHRKQHRGINAPRKHVDQVTRLATSSSPVRGTLLPRLCSPLARDIHTQVAYTRSRGVHRGPHVYSDCRGLPGGR